MATFAKPPCDEAVILAGSCEIANTKNGVWILAATILGSSMTFIDGTVVNVVLPALQSAFTATLADVQWVVESYALFLAALLLVGGSLGDRYGRRRIFVAGVLTFSLASAWCGLAPNITHLIFARSIQGVGGAMLVPGSLALISANFPEEQRGRAIGTWSGFTSITAAIGPLLGGWFTEHGSWRFVFFINVPIGLAVLLLTLWKVPESRAPNQGQQFDWLGGLLAVLGFGGIVLALIESIPAAGAIGAVALIALLYWEARTSSPMVPFRLFRSSNFSGANLLTFFLYAALNGMLFFFPLDLIQVQGYSSTEAGAALLPLIFVNVLPVAMVGRFARSIWRENPIVSWSSDRSRGIRLAIQSGYWRFVLDHVPPGRADAGVWHGNQRSPAHHHGDGRCGSKLRRSGFRNQQCHLTHRRFAGGGCFRCFAVRNLPKHARPPIAESARSTAGPGTNRGPNDQNWARPKRKTREAVRRSMRHLWQAIARCYG